ncbi:MAG: bacillithiol biosynthesis cysteine-adding enzyme BshC [Acidobacteria bacterium]|nr:MAG: bacillithiol biosynthesis cysteine-adding enzyme BshC [Acidobacteriota bacterium]REK01209.1 MAG: bacillithiol biosynthesis cysteine-adding enzyme BshC [Acidobacteriota bacterium]REK14165.1 MAG: bacillithiol biosynthesis cysteine-adding enzyme BshC [Acidobacteriota bacterium]REK44880.1 MAG: bacillithiol biosynthesis cysteine-adding enzyme BshC [Acidobacteriota bacterium]
MNDQPGAAAGARPYTVSYMDHSSAPGQSAILIDLLRGSPSIAKYFPNSQKELYKFVDELIDSYKADRQDLCSMLDVQNRAYGAGEDTLANIQKLAENDCVTVITGQQAGLFSGPAYTIYKAITAIKQAKRLKERGIKAVPVFWIASEDHDLEEVRSTTILGDEGNQISLSMNAEEEDVGRPVGHVSLGIQVSDLVRVAADALPEGDSGANAKELISECYAPGETYSSAFARLLSKVFGKYGLIVVSPLDEAFRELARPLVREAVKKADLIRDALLARDEELATDGYHSQVHVGKDFFPFFLIERGKRIPLRLANADTVERQDTGQTLAIGELLKSLDADATILSPNALMRPAIQDYVFPNALYYGGSAEIAYFAQNSKIYELLGRPVTPIRHRSAYTVVAPRNRRTLNAYGLSFEDVLQGKEVVSAKVIEEFLDPETAQLFERTRNEVERLVANLSERLEQSEPTLAESLSKRREKILWHIETLHRKFLQSEAFKDDVAAKRLDYLFNTMLPNDAPQERILSGVSFLAEYGPKFTEWLLETADTEGRRHTVLTF